MDSSKRIVLGLTIVTLGVLLGGCKTNQNDNSESLKQARSLKEENSLLKENSRLKAKQRDLDQKENSSTPATRESEPSSSNSTSNLNTVNSPDDAIALAKSKYGDNNGDWHWECLSNGSGSLVNGQYYFVKAISQSEIQNGSMTGTVKSLRVYTNGTIEEN